MLLKFGAVTLAYLYYPLYIGGWENQIYNFSILLSTVLFNSVCQKGFELDVEQAKTKENREVLWDTFLFLPIAFLCLYGIIKVKSIAGQRVNKPLFIFWQSFMWVIQILQQNPMKSLVVTPPPQQ